MSAGSRIHVAVVGLALAILAVAPAREAHEHALRIRGRVSTSFGPLAGARVELIDVAPPTEAARRSLLPAGTGLFDPDPVLAIAVSGEDGTFEIVAPGTGRFTAAVRAPGHRRTYSRAVNVVAGRPAPQVGIRLGDAMPIDGVVKDEAGKPVAGALVVVFCSDDLLLDDALKGEHIFTGADGRFRAVIASNFAGIAVRAKGHAIWSENYWHPAEPSVEIVLKRGATVEGSVVDVVSGQGIAGARVAAVESGGLPPAAEAVTDFQGRYRLEDVPHGTELDLVVAGPGFAPVPPNNLKRSGRRGTTVFYEVEPIPPGGTARCDITMAGGATVSGRVLDAATMTGIEGAEVVLVQPHVEVPGRSTQARALSGPGGSFSIVSAPAGHGGLFAWKEGWFLHPDDAEKLHPGCHGQHIGIWPEIRPGEVIEGRTIRLERGIPFSGVVQDPDGRPVAGAGVQWNDDEWLLRSGLGIRIDAEAITDARGRFAFAAVPRNRSLDLSVEHPEWPCGVENEVLSRDQPIEGFTVTAPAVARIAGRLLLPDGGPAAGVVLCAVTGSAPATQAVTDEKGGFRFVNVLAGPCRIQFGDQKPGVWAAVPDSGPDPGAPPVRPGGSDFDLENRSPPRVWHLEPKGTAVVVDRDRTARAELRLLPPLAILGRVHRYDGEEFRPVPGMKVRIVPVGRPDDEARMVNTDVEGNYVFSGLSAGRYRVAIEALSIPPVIPAIPAGSERVDFLLRDSDH